MKHSIGFNVRQDGVNYPDVLAQVKRQGGVRCMLFHVDISSLHRLRPFLEWCDLIIWRPREWASETLYTQFPIQQFSSGATTNGAMNYIDMCIQALQVNGLPLDKVAIHLHNEAGIGAQVIQWDTMAAQRAVEKGARVVGLNVSVGTPDNIEDAELYIRYAAANPDSVLIGIHDGYFSVYGHRKERWYLRRWERYWEDWRTSQGDIGPVKYVITEGGAEDIADDHDYTDALPRTSGYAHIGGVHTLDAAWNATYGDPVHNLKPRAYPGKDRAYLEQLQIAFDTGNHGDSRVVGWCLYSWGGGGRWTAYDVSHMGAFLADLAETEFVIGPIPYPVPPEPERVYYEIAKEDRIRVRNAPRTGDVIGHVDKLEIVKALAVDGEPGSQDEWWLFIERDNGQQGWVAGWFFEPAPGSVEPYEPPVEPPAPTPEPEPEPPTPPDDDTPLPPSALPALRKALAAQARFNDAVADAVIEYQAAIAELLKEIA